MRQLLVDALNDVCKGETAAGQPFINPKQPINVVFAAFGDSSIDLKVCVWMLVEEKIRLTGICMETIYNVLRDNNIEIPFPQRDITIRNTVNA